MRYLLLGLLALSILPAQAQPRQSLVPGGLAIIDLDPQDRHDYRFRGKPVLVTRIGGATSALVGLPLSLKPELR